MVYSTDPDLNTLGGLTGDPWYNAGYATDPPAAIPAGDRFVYTRAPQLTVTADNQSREYGLVNPAFIYGINGLIGGDLPGNAVSGTPTLSTAATQFSDVSDYNVVPLLGTLTSPYNYGFQFADGMLTVTQAPLAVAADDGTRIYGDPDPVFTQTYSGFRGADTATTIDTPPTLTSDAVATSNVGDGYGIMPSGGSDNNYSFVGYTPGALTITQAPLTAAADDKSREYGDVNPPLTVSYSGFKNGEDDTVLDVVSFASTAAAPTADAGTAVIAVAGGSDNNYSFNYLDGILMIAQAPLTVAANDQSRKYGEVNPALTLNYTGFKLADTVAALDLAPVAATVATPASNVGIYAVTPSGGSDNNYAYRFIDGILTVAKAPLTVSAVGSTREYGESNDAIILNYAGFKLADTAEVIDTPPAADTAATPASDVGNYPVTLSGGSDDNYLFTNYTDGVMTIVSAPLTVTADDQSREYGDPNPPLTFVYSGFKLTDDAAVFDSPPAVATAAVQSSDAGSYPITLSGGSDANYLIDRIDGTLSIAQAPLMVTADDNMREYGDPNPILTLSYNGFKSNDTVAALDLAPVAATAAIQTSDVGNYPIVPVGGHDDNYAYTAVDGTLIVSQAPLAVSAVGSTREYGEPNDAIILNYTGFKLADTAEAIDIPPAADTAATPVSDVGNYPVAISGGSDDNYLFTGYTDGVMMIVPAILTVTADDQSREYGDSNPPLTFVYSGFKLTDDAAALDNPPVATAAVQSSDAGRYPITLSGGSDANYLIDRIDGTLSIAQASLTVIADDNMREYGDPNPILTLSYNGFKLNDYGCGARFRARCRDCRYPNQRHGNLCRHPLRRL